jgi:PKD repeat protein
VFDFGDGTTTSAGVSATATHSYTSAGTYTATVTVKNTSGLTSTATATVTVTAPPGYVSQLGTSSASTNKTTGFVTVTPTASVKAGDLVVVTLQLAKTSSGTVTVTDAVANTYTIVKDVSNSSGRLVILFGIAVKALAVNQKITARFPKSGSYQMAADELTAVTKLDQNSAQTGTGTSYSSGATSTTTAAREVVFGAVALFGGTGKPTWASGWTGLPPIAVGTNYLGRSYQLPTATGAFSASGNGSGSWLAATVTFKP